MRTRFPPSPTGFLHVGSLRTALFSYLVARQTKGTFILRIEDTDKVREVPGSIEDILKSLYWASLEPDEGVMLKNGQITQEGSYGPYIQSERTTVYKKHVEELVKNGRAYYAFDSVEELDRMRNESNASGIAAPKYDVTVRMRMRNSLTMSEKETEMKLSAGEPYVIRMKVPDAGIVRLQDEIRGTVEFKTIDIDDQILMKSDGFPTYHLANVVDDHLMKVDMVIRGEEWLSSTPKHLLLFKAFGWDPPKYAHVPLLLNKGGGKLSKRQGDVAVSDYIAEGYLPEAMVNFIAMLGWNPGTTQEIFSLSELIEAFSIDRIQKGGAVFDTEKLLWFQGQWVRKIDPKEFAVRIRDLVAKKYPEAKNDPRFSERAALIQERITFFKEAPEMMAYYYEEPWVTVELLANKKQKVEPNDLRKILDVLVENLESISENAWTVETLKAKLLPAAESAGFKTGQVLWPLRAALTGLPFSPGAFEVAVALGKEKTMLRLSTAKTSLGH